MINILVTLMLAAMMFEVGLGVTVSELQTFFATGILLENLCWQTMASVRR